MASLMDTIQQNSNSLAGQQQGVSDQSNQVAQLLRAKSGKSVSGPGVAASNLGEQQAVSNTNNAMQNQVAPAAAMQGRQLQQQSGAIQQQNQNQLAGVAQQRQADTVKTNLKVNETLSDLERTKGSIDQARQRAAMDQVGTNLRLQTQQYTNDLQRQGTLARLNDEGQFNEALSKSVLGANKDLLEDKLNGQSILDVSNNQYASVLSQMGVNDSWNIFKNDQNAAQTRANYTNAAAGVGAGASIYGTAANQGYFNSSNTSSSPEGSESAGINSNAFGG